MRDKNYFLKKEEFESLVPNKNGYCVVSDKIMVDGEPVGYMYRDLGGELGDSGWWFFSGRESQAYNDNPDNFGVYGLNTIANYDKRVLPLLSAPAGLAYFGKNLEEEDYPIPLAQLSHQEQAEIVAHVENYVGPIERLVSLGEKRIIDKQFLLVSPTEVHPFYTVITTGMSSREMNVCSENDKDLALCELCMTMPADWVLVEEVDGKERFKGGESFWPFRVFFEWSRIAFEHNYFLRERLSRHGGGNYSSNTGLTHGVLGLPPLFETGFQKMERADGKIVNFYQLHFVYPNELEYVSNHGMKAFTEKLVENNSVIIDTFRDALDV